MEFVLTFLFWSVVVGVVGAALWQQNFRRQFMNLAEAQASRLDFLAKALPLQRDTQFPLRSQEEYVYHLDNMSLIEPRRAPRVTRRSTDAVTVALAKGIYYTAAGGKSVSPEPEDELREIDRGTATFTTQRVVFVGSKQTRDWDFAKLLGWDVGAGGQLMIAVSNRQKVSGIQMINRSDLMPDVVMQIAGQARDEGWDWARELCERGAKNARTQAQFVRNNTWAGEEKITAFVHKLDEQEEIELSERARQEEATQGETSTPGRRKVSSPRPQAAELEVVGEFFYKESFAKLREILETDGGTEHVVEAELRNDPDNPHSESGMAVAVFVRGLQVGHVPESIAPNVFEQLEPKGGTVTLGARLWLDYKESKPNKSSVTVYLDSRLQI